VTTASPATGFDAKKRKADLRLDVPEGAFTAIDGVFPIKPGDPEVSSIIQRIVSTDEDEMMPPPDSHKKVTAAQVEILKRWIKEGAEYKKHWAFEAPVKAAPPPVKGMVKNGIDAFIQARLAQEGLSPSPEASKESLIRRVTLDLTGLPPTLAEIDAFLADTSPDAYEKVVARLLKSERYGEHMGRLLAGCGALRGHAWPASRQRAQHVALSRLGGERVQCEPAV
jgi:hypothetical protein